MVYPLKAASPPAIVSAAELYSIAQHLQKKNPGWVMPCRLFWLQSKQIHLEQSRLPFLPNHLREDRSHFQP
jgi:hypothetical protein